MRHKVFVYGSLKAGHPHHQQILRGLEGKSALARGFDLRSGPGYPYAVRGRGTVYGEMYEIDEQTLRALDRFEEHPRVYRRELVQVELVDGGRGKAWMYVSSCGYDCPRLPGGEW